MEGSDDTAFRHIGQGFCGTVWSTPNGTVAMKREDGGPGRSIENDFTMHQRCLEALRSSQSSVTIPECYQYVNHDDTSWWDENLSLFPEAYQHRCNVLVTQRLQPFSKVVRDRIADLYCPDALKTRIKDSDPDQDCLIRPYLGRRRRSNKQTEQPPRFQAFSLRNFPLHAD